MNLKDCKVVSEAADHFVVEKVGGKPFKVAKAGLRPDMVIAIQRFASGGVVQPVSAPLTVNLGAGALDPSNLRIAGMPTYAPPAPVVIPPAPALAPTPEQIAEFERAANPIGSAGAPPTGWASPSKRAADDAGLGGVRAVADVVGNIGNAWLGGGNPPAQVPGLPAAQGAGAATALTQAAPSEVDAVPVAPGTGAAPPRMPGVSIPRTDTRAIDAALEMQEKGVNAQAEAAAGEAAAREAALRQKETEAQALRQRFDDEMGTLNEKRTAMEQEIKDGKIEPGRFWGSKSTGQKVSAGIAMMLGGFGGALMKTGRNGVAEMFDRMIEQDIAAQRDDRSNKQSLLQSYMQQGRDAQAAYGLAKADLTDLTATRIEMAAAQYGDDKARAAAQQVSGQLRLTADQTRRGAVAQGIQNAMHRSAIAANNAQAQAASQKGRMDASQAALNAALARGEEIPVEVIGNLDEKVQKKLVQVAPGKFAAAYSEDGAKKVREALAAKEQLMALTKRAREIRGDLGGDGTITNRAAIAEADSIQQQITFVVKEAGKLGVMSDQDQKMIEKMNRNAAAYQSDDAFEASMGSLDTMVKNTADSTANSNLMRRARTKQGREVID